MQIIFYLRRTLLLGVLSVALMLLGCNDRLAGGSSETGNNTSITGRVSLANKAKVVIHSEDYLAPLSDSSLSAPAGLVTETDESGAFMIKSVKPGKYLIEVTNQDSMAVLFNITVDSVPPSLMHLEPKTLEKMQVVTGGLSLSPGDTTSFIRVFGMDRLVKLIGTERSFKLLLPTGDLSLQFSSSNKKVIPVEKKILVKAGSNNDMGKVVIKASTDPYYGWKYTNKVMIQTGSVIPPSKENLLGFPILVRLNNENFFFAQAQADGSDIRFTKADGITPLPYEIERWNSTLSVAEVWVRVDTIYSDSRSQSILMYSGNANALSLSDGKNVFNSTNGFRSVWHLGEKSTSTRVKDAAGNFDGILKSGTDGIFTEAIGNPSVIGNGFLFSGAQGKTWIDLGQDKNFLNHTSEVSISFWMNNIKDTRTSTSVMSVSINGDLNSSSPESRISFELNNDSLALYSRANDTISLNGPKIDSSLTIGQLVFVTGVIDLVSQKTSLYINGELIKTLDTKQTGTQFDSSNSTHVAIAANDIGNQDYFHGSLDEFRMDMKARSASWIRLNYENQKRDQSLIKIIQVQ